MICIFLSASLSWILEAAEVKQFTYQPMCCLGTVAYPEPGTDDPLLSEEEWYPKPGGGFYPQPTCVNAFTVPGHGEMDGEPDDDDKKYFFRSPASVAANTDGSYNITVDGTTFTHTGSLLFKGIADGRDSTFKGGCDDTCHAMMGGFNSACFGSVMVETGCWTAFSYQNRADGKLLVDEFGEGCRGGAGRIPKTFKHPTGIVDAPKIEIAGDLKAPFPGWAGCDADGNNCKSGDVDGGAISSHVEIAQSVAVFVLSSLLLSGNLS